MSTQFTKLPVCNTITNITATASLYEQFVLYGIQRGADWALTTDHVTGDDTDITFSWNSFLHNFDELILGTTYYWKIIATDNHRDTNEGPTWTFITEGTK